MSVHDIDVDILVNGRPVKKYSHQGRVFVEAKHGNEYSIKIRNNSGPRRLAVVTVDGLNVLDGEVGGTTKAGYVVNGYSSISIKGFRTSNEVVHPFKFNHKEQSYAAKSDVTNGDTCNCGVIGVEVFEEKVKPEPQILLREVIREVEKPILYPTPYWWPRPTYTWSSSPAIIGQLSSTCQTEAQNENALLCVNFADSNTFGSNITSCSLAEKSSVINMCVEEPKRRFDMGTEFSHREVVDKVRDVDFEISIMALSLSIYYASRESLIYMGVPVNKETQVAFPDPFPAKFCRPPSR